MASNSINNPWKGLNFYTEGEVLYGRNSEIQSLSQYIFNNTQTVLYGRSGIGKSSILNAGIFPKARVAGMIPVSIRLKHDEENNYLEQIRLSIETAGLIINEILPPINGIENETLWEFMHRHTFNNGDGDRRTPLLVFDQFEEIFTLQKKENVKREFFRQLGNLFNDVKPAYIVEHENQARQQQTSQQETKVVSSGAFKGLNLKLNIRRNDSEQEKVARYIERPDYHIVFAMREDFLSSLELYAASIPVMKDNRFGLLPINEEQAADIIRLPREGLVDNKVTKLIIQQVTGREDFELDGKPEIEVDAAVLSLFLSRLYIKKPEQENCITSELVNTYSGHIIHDFYVDSVTSNEDENEYLSKDTILLLENLLLTREGRRNNVSRSDLIAQGVTEEELTILIEKRKLLRQFHHGNDIRIEYIHDILCPVVKERIEQRELLLQQELERKRQEEEKRRLQKEAEERQREIEEKATKEKAELEAEAQKTKIRNRRIYAAIASLFIAAVLSGTYYCFANLYTYKSYYKEFTRINGWPVGIGNQLSDSEQGRTPLYYCLSHKGCKSPILRLFGIVDVNDKNTDVEILSSNARLPHKPRVASFEIVDDKLQDEKAIAYNELLSNIYKIHFVEGEGNTVEKEIAFNGKDSMLFVINYFHINKSEMWSSFVSPSGQAMQIRENGIDRTKITLDSLGRALSMMYYDQNGVIQPIHDEVCGYAWEFGTVNNEEKRYILNQFSLPIDNGYNMVVTEQSGDTTITRYRHVMSTDDKLGVEAVGPEGFCLTMQIENKELMYVSESAKEYSTKITTRDAKGNVQKELISNILSSKVPTVTNYSYDNDGNLIRMEKLTSANVPFVVNEKDDYLYEWEYKDGKKVSEIRRNKTQITYQHTIETKNNVTREVWEDVYADKYLIKVDSTFKDGYSTSYFGRNNQPINHKVCLEEDSVTFHRKRCVLHNNEELRYFYVFDETEKKAPLIFDGSGTATSYFCKEIKKNNEGLIVAYKEKDENDKIVKSMMFFTMNGQIIGRAVEGVDGTPVRCNNWEEENYMYYKIYYIKDFEDNFVGIRGMNEWGQASVFYDFCESEYKSVSYQDFKGYELILNSNRNIKVIRSYKQYVLNQAENMSNFSYPYLHILDKTSCLYKSGFKDNDRIVKFGNWSIGNSLGILSNEWNTSFNLNKKIRIEVLRPLPNGSLTRISKEVNCTHTSIDLQEYHELALTNEEYNYLTHKTMLK